MFKRLRNLLRLSQYSIVDDKEPKLVRNYKPSRKMATIVNMEKDYNFFNELEYDTDK